jgi:hypothetical protein
LVVTKATNLLLLLPNPPQNTYTNRWYLPNIPEFIAYLTHPPFHHSPLNPAQPCLHHTPMSRHPCPHKLP